MPSYLHETLVEMFRDRPTLAPDLLAGQFGISVPAFDRAGLSSADLTDRTPTEYRADVVITLTVSDTPVLAVVVEAQIGVDARKQRSWPAYVATLYARLGCPVALLVVCPKSSVAARCAVPIKVGEPNFVLTPLVLGPDQVPLITDPEVATRNPELTMLSAMAHGEEVGHVPLFEALLAAFKALDLDHANLYYDVLLAALPAAARRHLEAFMTTTGHRYHSDFARGYFDAGKAEGKAEGEATAVLGFLDARGIDVPEDVRQVIIGCTDLQQLRVWIRRAATADKVQDLFDARDPA